ncbi:branched-chain amino acid ABC transporter permease, partial [candidate division MSBL1 archaeon SCGC-AAA259D14]
LGAATTATAQDAEMAKMVGVNVGNIQVLTMFLSAVLAAIAGIFYAQNYTITPEIGIIVLLFAFAIVILGGLGSIGGSIVGSFIVGYITTTVMLLGGIRYGYIITLLIVIVTLIVRPRGLFGKEARI